MRLTFILILFIVFNACSNKEDSDWIKTSNNILEYRIEKKGKDNTNGEIGIKEADSTKIPEDFKLLAHAIIEEELSKAKLPVGTEGYCRINIRRWYDSLRKETFHLSIFLRPDMDDEDSTTLLNKLKILGYFESLRFISKDMALREWKDAGGEDFEDIDLENFLPLSIEADLKEQYLNVTSLDSIKRILLTDSDFESVRTPRSFQETENGMLKEAIVFKFVIF